MSIFYEIEFAKYILPYPTAPVGHAGPRKGILETCSAQKGAEACDVLLSCSAPSMGARDQREYQWASAGVLPERQGHHGYARGLHPTEVP